MNNKSNLISSRTRFHLNMLFQAILQLLLLPLVFSQSIIRIGIIDDHHHFKGIVPIHLSNLTFCGQKNLNLRLHWMNASSSSSQLLNDLEWDENTKHFYLTSTDPFSTKLIADFCQSNQIPFLNINEEDQRLCSLTTFVESIDFFLFFLTIVLI